MKRAYLRLCPEKRRKKNSGGKGLKSVLLKICLNTDYTAATPGIKGYFDIELEAWKSSMRKEEKVNRER